MTWGEGGTPFLVLGGAGTPLLLCMSPHDGCSPLAMSSPGLRDWEQTRQDRGTGRGLRFQRAATLKGCEHQEAAGTYKTPPQRGAFSLQSSAGSGKIKAVSGKDLREQEVYLHQGRGSPGGTT